MKTILETDTNCHLWYRLYTKATTKRDITRPVTGTGKTYSDQRDSEKLFSPELEKINRVADKWLNPRSSADYAVR